MAPPVVTLTPVEAIFTLPAASTVWPTVIAPPVLPALVTVTLLPPFTSTVLAAWPPVSTEMLVADPAVIVWSAALLVELRVVRPVQAVVSAVIACVPAVVSWATSMFCTVDRRASVVLMGPPVTFISRVSWPSPPSIASKVVSAWAPAGVLATKRSLPLAPTKSAPLSIPAVRLKVCASATSVTATVKFAFDVEPSELVACTVMLWLAAVSKSRAPATVTTPVAASMANRLPGLEVSA